MISKRSVLFLWLYVSSLVSNARQVTILKPSAKPVTPLFWAEGDPLLRAYHDEEWGVPEHNSRKLWEMLMLEGFKQVFRDHYPSQARSVSQGVRELRSKTSRAFRKTDVARLLQDLV